MFRRVVGGLINLFGRLIGRGTKSIDTRLDAIEERLERIEDKVERQAKFAVFAYVYGLGLAVVVLGLAIRPGWDAVGLMVSGLVLMIGSGLLGLFFFYMRR